MPKTVKGGFEKLKANLQVCSLTDSAVAVRLQKIVGALEPEFAVIDSFPIGSYTRRTLIAPLSKATVDLLTIFDCRHGPGSGQAALLEEMRAVLRRTYPQSPEINESGQAITIRFKDYRVNVIPGFAHNGVGYLIPAPAEPRWIRVDPRHQIRVWEEADRAHAGRLAPLMRMVKGWNNQYERLLRSFHLETLVLQVMHGIEIADFASGMRFFLDRARNAVFAPVADPASEESDIGGYLDISARFRLLEHLELAYRRALEAEQWEYSGKTWQAYIIWHLIFGDYFPDYEC